MSENKNVGGITRVRTDNTGYNSPYLASNIPNGRQTTRVMHFEDCKTEQELIDRIVRYYKRGYVSTRKKMALLALEILHELDEKDRSYNYIPPVIENLNGVVIADYAKHVAEALKSK